MNIKKAPSTQTRSFLNNNKQSNNTIQKPITQDKAVLKILQERGTINPLEALKEIGCFRLSARIHNLRNKGYNITTERITKNGHFGKVCFAEYHLLKEVVTNG